MRKLVIVLAVGWCLWVGGSSVWNLFANPHALPFIRLMGALVSLSGLAGLLAARRELLWAPPIAVLVYNTHLAYNCTHMGFVALSLLEIAAVAALFIAASRAVSAVGVMHDFARRDAPSDLPAL